MTAPPEAPGDEALLRALDKRMSDNPFSAAALLAALRPLLEARETAAHNAALTEVIDLLLIKMASAPDGACTVEFSHAINAIRTLKR